MSKKASEEKQKMYENIMYILNEMEKIHPCLYYKISKKEILEKINNFMKNENINTKPEYLYFLTTLVSSLGDPHTSVDNFLSEIPFKFRIINDQVYVLDTNNEYKNLTGKEVKAINGVDIKTIMSEMRKLYSATVPEWKEAEIERNLNNLCTLWMLPSIEGQEVYTYKIGEEDYTFNLEQKFDYSGLLEPNYSYNYIEKENIINIKYRKCRDDKNYPFTEFVSDIKKVAEEKKITDFIIDLRGNTGGDSSIIYPLINYLKGKNMVTIVDKHVFSSGSLALLDLLHLESKTIGTGIGTTFNNFGDIHTFSLPNINLKAWVSKKYFYEKTDHSIGWVRGKKDFNKFIQNKKNKKYFEPQIFKPDIFINYTKDDLKGKNMEEAAIEEIKKNIIKM